MGECMEERDVCARLELQMNAGMAGQFDFPWVDDDELRSPQHRLPDARCLSRF
jgi:hypothetical protein